MDKAFKAWIGHPVVLQVALGDIKVPLRGRLLKVGGETVRMRIGDGWDVDIYKTMILAVEEDAMVLLPAMRETTMKTQELKYVTRRRAAVLLGISEMELSRISTESGFGHREIAGEQEETYFTYEELRQICLLAVQNVN